MFRGPYLYIPEGMSTSPLLRNQWSAETLLSAIKCMDADAALAHIQADLPDDPDQLAELYQAAIV